MTPPPPWRLPPGVDPALWDYASSDRLAEEEAGYFADDPLTKTDEAVLRGRFTEPGDLIDLGSGAGRLSLAFARQGFRVVAVDLSFAMLRTLGGTAEAEGLAIDRVRADLCRLGGIEADRFDYAIAMYSTLGMIAGAEDRRAALASAARVLRPGGRLALHAHNLWLNLFDRQGRRWLIEDQIRRLSGRVSGNRRMTYRGLPGLSIHLYRWPELRADLEGAGFQIEEVVPLDAQTAEVIRCPRPLRDIRAGGWIVFARQC